MSMTPRIPYRPITAGAIALLMVFVMAGCHNLMPTTGPKTYLVKATYTDLENRSVAVLVATGEYIDFNHPAVREQLTREVTQRIATNVPGVQVTDPEQVLRFQEENPYWTARAPSELIRALDVERLIIVEVGEYRTHDPGNRHVLRGVVSGNVNLLEAEAAHPDNYAFGQSVRAVFPDETRTKIGTVTLSEEMVETEARRRFAEDSAGVFYDHKVVR